MFVVALTELRGAVEDAAVALSADLGITVYEARMLASAPAPIVISTTNDGDRASALAARLVARGLRAVACDDREVVRSRDMRLVRRFRFEPECFVTELAPGGEDRLPYDDVLAIFRAMHERVVESTTEVTERKLAAGRILATGGVIATKTSTRQVNQSTEDREQVLYLFRRSNERPWILREWSTQYVGLGPDLQPARAANFAVTMERLKVGCPSAAFDERLVTAARATRRSVATRTGAEISSADGIDLLAHLLALNVARTSASPYRG